jgi:hypothetical protein
MQEKTLTFKNSPYTANVHICLDMKNGQYVFSATAQLRKSKSWVEEGQCIDHAAELIKNPILDEINELWKLYHLNDMHPGTREQEAALDEGVAKGLLPGRNADYYTQHCDYLKSVGLYEVDYGGAPYKYGHGWLLWTIPDEDIQKIQILFGTTEEDIQKCRKD